MSERQQKKLEYIERHADIAMQSICKSFHKDIPNHLVTAGYRCGFDDGYKYHMDHLVEVLDEDYAWAIYNFINEWKSGKYGEITLQKAIKYNFKFLNMDKLEKIEDFLSRMQGLIDNAKKRGHIIVRVEDLENTFPELRESNDEEKPNGGIVLEDFNEGDGFYKINLAYLSKEQVEEIENTVKKWYHKPIESEDERMWKLIKKYVHYNISDTALNADRIMREQLESWLEKQGKHLTNYDEAEKEKSDFVGDGFIECHADFLDFKEGDTYWLEYIGDDKYNVRSDNLLGKTYHITPCQLYTIFKKLTWLEKQDIFSKKDVDDAYLKGVTDTKNEIEKQYEANYQIRKDIATFLFNYKGDIKDRSKWMNYLGVFFVEKQGEKPQGKSALEAINKEKIDNQNCVKPTDKDEPRFKVRDWVVDNCSCVWKIEGILDQFYILECPEGGEYRPTIEWVDRNFHLWTIQDANDGDVLVDKYNNIGIFQKCVGICWYSYIYLGCDGEIRGFNIGGSHGQTDTHPATKEQRDLLFQTMKEAGYEWDANNKELKKIEKKFEEKLTIPSLKDFQEAFELKAKQYEIELPNRGYDIYAMCKELYSLLIKSKPTWSEEDEKIRQTIINEFEQCSEWYCSNGLTKKDCINWLNKQEYFEWSDEDNENMNSLFVLLDQVVSINAIDNEHSVEYKNWLKSIKGRIGGISYDTRR